MRMTEEILIDVMKGSLQSVIKNKQEVNNVVIKILDSKTLSRIQIEDSEYIIRICNILYNNTDLNITLLDDGVYDLLLEKYREYNPNFQVGADIVHFKPTKGKINAIEFIDHIHPKNAIEFFNEEEERVKNTAMYEDVLFPEYDIPKNSERIFKPLEYAGDYSKFDSISHSNTSLVGTLDKCKYVFNEQAICAGVYDALNVKILERDFFVEHIKKGIIYPNQRLEVVTELKYDGTSVVVEIENGEVVLAYSRGDLANDKASNYTPIFKGYKFPALPKDLEGRLEVKCEAIMTFSALRKYNEVRETNYKNCRTAINGLFSSNDAPLYRDFITLVPLKVVGIGDVNRIDEIDFINRYLYSGEFLRACVMSGTYIEILHQVHQFVKEATTFRDYLNFMFDGIVVSYVNDDIINQLGRNNFINQYSVAVKFHSLRKQTIIRSVEWSIGKNGVFVPVAHYDPVEFFGTIHAKATLGSFEKFNSMDLYEGDIIEVEYTNDVMPSVFATNNPHNSNDKIPTPDFCPYCNTKLVASESGDTIRCDNFKCPERTIKRVTDMITKLDIDNFRESSVRSLGVKNLVEFLTLEESHIFKVLGKLNSYKLKREIDRLKTRELYDYQIIGSLGFSDIAIKTWKKILSNIDISTMLSLYNEDPNKLISILSSIHGIGAKTTSTIINEMDYLLVDLYYIESMKNVIKVSDSKDGINGVIVFSGFRNQDIEQVFHKLGYEVSYSSVTKSTKYLIVPSEQYESSKTAKAEKYNIPILTIAQAKELFKF